MSESVWIAIATTIIMLVAQWFNTRWQINATRAIANPEQNPLDTKSSDSGNGIAKYAILALSFGAPISGIVLGVFAFWPPSKFSLLLIIVSALFLGFNFSLMVTSITFRHLMKDRDRLLFEGLHRGLDTERLALDAVRRATESPLLSQETALSVSKDKLNRVQAHRQELETELATRENPEEPPSFDN
ncbi:MAG: hypothetical protein QOH63_4262 [Acidobacteriota bacterium]|jgi:hypothetical protein|nr:hypothetical protein [Acidobacteriota bacterium]